MGIIADLVNLVRGTEKKDPPPKTTERSSEGTPYYDDSQARPYNPAKLFQKRGGYQLYDETLLDDVVDSLLEYKTNLVLGGGFRVESDDDDVREFWEHALNEGYHGSFRESLRKILSALAYGFSFTEKLFGPIEMDGKTYWSIIDLKTRPPHGALLNTDRHGNLESITQQGAGENGEDLDLKPEDFVVFTYRKKFENPYGQGDITPGMYRNVFSKRQIIKFLNIALERYAIPTAVGTHPESAAQEDIDEFFNSLDNLTSKATITKTPNWVIELLEAKRDLNDTFIKSLDFFNLAIARGFLVSDLQGISGKQMSGGGLGGGLGSVQFEVMMELFGRTGKDLENVVNKAVISPVTEWNFGKKKKAWLKLEELTRRQKDRAAEQFMNWMSKGGQPTDEQTNWLMETIGAPVGEQIEDQDDDGLIPEPGPEGGRPDENPGPDIPPEPAPGLDQNKGQFTTFSAGSGTGPMWEAGAKIMSERTPYEQRVNFAAVDSYTRKAAAEHEVNITNAIRAAQRGFYEMIRNRRIIEGKKFALLRQLKFPGMVAVRVALGAMLDDGLKSGVMAANEETSRGRKKFAAVDASAEIAVRAIIEEWKRSRVFSLTKSISEDMLGQAEVVLADAMRSGAGSREAIKILDRTLEGTVGKARLEMVARTNFMSAFTQGRLQSFRQAPGITGMQWSAVMDGRTSDICSSLHGKVVRPSEVNDYPMPAHPNCRSVWVAVFEEDIEGKKENEVFGGMPNVERKGGFMALVKPKS